MSQHAAIDFARTVRAPRNDDEHWESPLHAGSAVADRYVVGALLAARPVVFVHEARDLHLARRVLVKVLRPELAMDSITVERFSAETQRIASLSNPHVSRVYDSGKLSTGEPYVVLERLEGESLERTLARRGRFSVVQAVDLVIEASLGLAEAHSHGIVHRDVRLQNLFMANESSGRTILKVTDFCVLNDVGASPGYISPEQATNSADIDSRTDVWSLGVVLFELITGRRPFEGESNAEVLAAVLGEPAPSIRALRHDVDRELEAVILRCLDKEPARRFKDANSLGQALALYGSEGVRSMSWAAPQIELDPVLPPPKRSLSGLWFGFALALAVVVLAAWSIFGPSFAEVGDRFRPAEVKLHDSVALDAEPIVRDFAPMLALPAGVYASRLSQDSDLRAEPEREVAAAARPVRYFARKSGQSYQQYLQSEHLVPLDDVWVRERHFKDKNGNDRVESDILDSKPADESSDTGAENGQH